MKTSDTFRLLEDKVSGISFPNHVGADLKRFPFRQMWRAKTIINTMVTNAKIQQNPIRPLNQLKVKISDLSPDKMASLSVDDALLIFQKKSSYSLIVKAPLSWTDLKQLSKE